MNYVVSVTWFRGVSHIQKHSNVIEADAAGDSILMYVLSGSDLRYESRQECVTCLEGLELSLRIAVACSYGLECLLPFLDGGQAVLSK